MATALGFPENELHTLLTAPTAELANKFAASASIRVWAYNKRESEKRDTTECSQSFPFMKLPPELRLQVYEAVFEDTFHDTVHKGTLDEFPRSGIRPRLSHRAALRRHLKTVMAILQTCRTVRAEAAAMAFQIADRYAKSTLISLKQLGAECQSYTRNQGSVGRVAQSPSDDSIFDRYREYLQRYSDLCVIHEALQLVEKDVSENRLRDNFDDRVEG